MSPVHDAALTPSSARRRVAQRLVQSGRSEVSLPLWRAEALRDPPLEPSLEALLSAAMHGGDLELASRYAWVSAALRMGTRWYPRDHGLTPPEPHRDGPRPWLSRPKLQHDMEQLHYLQLKGVLGEDVTRIVDNYRSVGERLHRSDTGDSGMRQRLSDEDFRLIGETYGRIVHVRDTPRVKRALSDAWDPRQVEAEYLERPPGVVVIDNFLSTEALENLWQFCLESTIWHANRYAYGRLGAFFRDGFNCPLLVQIAQQLREALPRVIGERYPLRQMWGFKYDSALPSNGPHADFAAVNVNFWLTPDEANLDPESGGLTVYDIEAPLDWDFHTYNERPDVIRQFLWDMMAKPMTVPYRRNRAVIFNSDLFHSTVPFRFRPDYESRRVNVTMLYGNREQDANRSARKFDAGMDNHALERVAWRSKAFSRARR